MRNQPILKTKRLILRPFKQGDAKQVKKLADRNEIAATTNLPHPYKEEMAKEWINMLVPEFQSGKGATYAITLKESGELIGAISLKDISNFYNHAGLGFWIGVPYWNKGYCTEAGKALLHYGFTERGLNRIYAGYMRSNRASSRVLKKLGMVYEGTQRQHVTKLGEYEDLDLMGILRNEWEKTKCIAEKIID